MSKKKYLTIESYVYITSTDNKILYYNTLNGRMLEYENSGKIKELTSQLTCKDNLQVIEIGDEFMKSKEVKSFIVDLKENFSGDLIDSDCSKCKPIQLKPMLNIKHDIEKMLIDSPDTIGEEIMSYLTEVTIYINNESDNLDEFYKDAYKQFLTPYVNSEHRELDIDVVSCFLDEIEGASVTQLNILGGNIFKYSQISRLVDLLNGLSVDKRYFINYADLLDTETITHEFSEDSSISLIVNMPVDNEVFLVAVEKLRKLNIDSNIIFCVESVGNVGVCEELIEQYNIESYGFQPYYNRQNIEFFKEAVFINKEDIADVCNTQKDILAKGVVNQLDFGKITIMNNGEIFANVNNPALGEIGSDPINKMLYSEMLKGTSWRRLRKDVKSCSECLYNQLCPSISNYEYVIGDYDLCNI